VQGPSDVWFGVGFAGKTMAEAQYAIIFSRTRGMEERILQGHTAGTRLVPQVSVLANDVVDGYRTVTIRRAMQGLTARHFNFSFGAVEYIWAFGSVDELGYHASRGWGTMEVVEASPNESGSEFELRAAGGGEEEEEEQEKGLVSASGAGGRWRGGQNAVFMALLVLLPTAVA